MRFPALLAIVFVALDGSGQTPASGLWAEFKAKREKLPSLHQEFDVSQTYKTANGDQSSKRQIVLDISQGRWREKSVTGSGSHIKIFDGKDIFWMEEGGDEFVRIKRHSREDPLPSPYSSGDPNWSKAMEVERRPCGVPGSDQLCVLLEVPLKPWIRNNGANATKMLNGSARIFMDTETGQLVALRTVEVIEDRRGWLPITYFLRAETYELWRACGGKSFQADF